MVENLRKKVGKFVIGGMLLFSGCISSIGTKAMTLQANVEEMPCDKFK